MRNATPMRWIEQKEARQVVATATYERSANAPWSQAGEAGSQWLPRLGSWLATRHPMGMARQMQPVLVRGPQVRRDDDDN